MRVGRKAAVGLGLAAAAAATLGVFGLIGCGTETAAPVADLTAPARVADLRLVSPTPTTIQVLWTAPGDDSIWGTASQYDLRFATSPITGATWAAATPCANEPSPGPSGTGETLLVSGLTPGITCYFALVACDKAANCSELSNVDSSRTTEHTLLVAWGGQGSAGGQMRLPRGLAVGAGVVYVADTGNNRIQKFTSDGALLRVWTEATGADPAGFSSPDGLALGVDGSLYVADVINDRILRLDGNGDLVAEYGRGSLRRPHSVAVDADGNLYVADTDNHMVKKFGAAGALVAQWGGLGSADGRLFSPRGVAIGPDGFIYVADTGNCRVEKFTAEGAFVASWGSPGLDRGRFIYPRRVAVSAGGIFVADSDTHRVEEFTLGREFRGQWGGEGTGIGQFDQPNDVALDPSGAIYVLDTSNHRLQKFTSAEQ
jgi:DNA-binding beta-propeller fold protein YncE